MSQQILTDIIELISTVIPDKTEIKENTPLIGQDALVSSRELVEILLEIEEYAEDKLKISFDWANDSAMSSRRSMFRSPKSLADHLSQLVTNG